MLCVAGVFLVVALFDLLPLWPGSVHAVSARLSRSPSPARRRGFGGWSARCRSRHGGASNSRAASRIARSPRSPTGRACRSTRGGALWEAHRRRMAAAIRRLRVGCRRPGSRARPVGLAGGAGDLLVVGAIDAGDDWRDRLVRALTPTWTAAARRDAPVSTSGSPRPTIPGCRRNSCAPANSGPVRVPTGSALLAQIHGGGPACRISSIDRSATTTSRTTDKQDFQTREPTLTAGKRIEHLASGDGTSAAGRSG